MMAFIAIIFSVALLAHYLPVLSRQGLFFGVTIDPAFSATPEARGTVRLYRSIVWLSFAVSVAAIAATGRGEAGLLSVAGFFAAIAVANRRACPHRASSNPAVEVDLAAPRETLPGGWVTAALPVALIGALALWVSQNWGQLPERLPVHVGLHGPDRWATRTTASVYGLLGVDALVSLFLISMSAGVAYWSRRSSATRRFRSFNAQAFIVLAYFPALQAWTVLLRPSAAGIWLIPIFVLTAVYYFLLIWERPRAATRSDYTPDSCWKLGVLYYNPADPAIFVMKRFGLGYAPNWGNRWSWAGLALILTVVAVRVIAR